MPGPEANQGNRQTMSKKTSDPEIVPAQHVEIDDDLKKDHMNYDRVDREVAKYVSDVAIHISPEENARLKSKVDKRVLSIMIFTYFLQALDKGTMSFASIMGIKKDTHLVGQQVRFSTSFKAGTDREVCLVDHMYIHRCSHCGIPHQPPHSTSSYRQISWNIHHSLGHHARSSRCRQRLHHSCHSADFTRDF